MSLHLMLVVTREMQKDKWGCRAILSYWFRWFGQNNMQTNIYSSSNWKQLHACMHACMHEEILNHVEFVNWLESRLQEVAYASMLGILTLLLVFLGPRWSYLCMGRGRAVAPTYSFHLHFFLQSLSIASCNLPLFNLF